MKTQKSNCSAMETVVYLKLTQIRKNKYNPRKKIDEGYLSELSESIKTIGLINPITVRPLDNGKFEIVCGERRYRAHKLAGLKTIPAVVRNLNDEEALFVALTENVSRKDITPMEEAKTFLKLLSLPNVDLSVLVKKCGRSETYVRDRLRLNDLVKPFHSMLENEEINIGQALVIAKCDPKIQEDIFKNHFAEESTGYKWFEKKPGDLVKLIQINYTTRLDHFNFDKSECMVCRHNTKQFLLFEDEGCGQCSRRDCLEEKNNTYVLSKALDYLSEYPTIIFNNYHNNPNIEVIKRLEALGHDICSIPGLRYTPEQPEVPQKEDFEHPDGYNKAIQEYEKELNEYNAAMDEIRAKSEQNTIQLLASIEGRDVSLCYIDIVTEEEGAAEKKIEELQNTIDLNETRKKKKIVEDLYSLVVENEIQTDTISEEEEKIIYYFMLRYFRCNRLYLLGEDYKDKTGLNQADAAKIVENLTEPVKNAIKKEFIIRNLSSYPTHEADIQKLYEFAELHFPNDAYQIKQSIQAQYDLKNAILKEKITTIMGHQSQEAETDIEIYPEIDLPDAYNSVQAA